MLDVRKPIGYLFLIIGAMILVYGIVQPQATNQMISTASGGTIAFNLDLICGASMFVFGGAMLALAHFDANAS
ncbi:MAG TPA: hypothetical protein V6D22_25170 [Candidatus Obscuribacterales bacterium]